MSYQKSFIPSESSEEARQVRKALERFLRGKEEWLEGVRPLVRDSWLRCRERAVDPGTKAAPIVLSQEQARNLQEENTLSKSAAPVLRFLYEALWGNYFFAALADSQCRLLEIVGHPKALDRAKQVNGVPGSQWSEDQVGTDSLATSLHLGMPVQIHWSEHYCEIGQRWAGSTAPIHHPFTKEVLGALSLCGYGEISHPQALELVTDSAAMIEQQLYEKELALCLFLFEYYNTHQGRFRRDVLLGMDAQGIILTASPGIENLLGLPRKKVIGRPLSYLLGLDAQESFPKLDGKELPRDLYLHTKTDGFLKATLLPVRKEHSFVGFIAILPANSAPAKKAQADSSWQSVYTFADIVGESANLLACIAGARKIAQEDLPVLITGESGTGKELFAHAIHNASRRQEGPFVPLNCGGMNEELIGTELFGYAEGAFTGAVRGGKAGKLEVAHAGTLFLDEVEEMPPKMQVCFLRVLEEGRVVRIGAEKPRPIDVRVIAATSIDLEARVREGRFRQDLYYRLNVLTLPLPPLRERRTDIPLLVKHVLLTQGIIAEVSAKAMERLKAYYWPGNVRQLRNTLLQAASRAVGGMITEADLPSDISSAACCPVTCPFPPEKEQASEREGTVLQKAEREAILQTLRDCNENISRAASQLGLHRATLYRKMVKYKIRAKRV